MFLHKLTRVNFNGLSHRQPGHQIASTRLLNQSALAPILVLVTLLTLVASILGESVFDAPDALIVALNLTSYLAGGFYALQAGIASLRVYEIDVDLLMIAAAVGAAAVGEWHEGAILLFLFSLSNVLQNYAIGRSRNAIKSLLGLRPETATLRVNGTTKSVPIDDLRPGDVLVIHPGERLPADGDVVSGSSHIDQSTITGESMPVHKDVGDKVFAGTVNQHGALDIRVSKRASESTLARIITMVEDAHERHANTQRALDRFEQIYAKVIIGAVLLLIVVPPLVFGVDFDANFYRAMVVLVVASPCALVISVPASIISAITNAARHGILFKGGGHLEDMAALKAIAFDKTGTLTMGRPQVTDIIPTGHLSADDLLTLLASAERHSEHPIARAIVARAEGLALHEPSSFEAIPGQGVVASLNGKTIYAGTEKLLQAHNLMMPESLIKQKEKLEQAGKTVVLVYNGGPLGLVAVADEIRAEAAEALRELRAAGISQIAMLTGDNPGVAARIAKQLGVTDIYASLMPDQKVERLLEIERRYGAVAMVGDGVNDAPALATASLGIAMGAAGTDVALETADVVLMANDLRQIAYAVKLSRQARKVVIQNLAFSLGVIAILLAATLLPFVDVPLPLGVVGHEGSTIIVVLNGLRLLVWKP
jgi:Cd2+/Zn2+-exporting ATPase